MIAFYGRTLKVVFVPDDYPVVRGDFGATFPYIVIPKDSPVRIRRIQVYLGTEHDSASAIERIMPSKARSVAL